MSDDTPIRTPFDAIDLDHLRRLEALEAYDILDTAPEPEFDDIVYIASTVCNTPVSLVSLVEADRQWFKARIGFEPGETPIDQSVCAHALTSPELLIIPDLTVDPRTRHNTLVTQSPFIRFYAGAPLIVPGGAVIGTLCVIDTVPRPEGLDENQQNLLRALARQVVAFMETRRVSHRKDELFQRQKRLAASIRNSANKNVAAQQAGRIGTFEIDIATSQVRASDEFCRIFDVPPPTSIRPRCSSRWSCRKTAIYSRTRRPAGMGQRLSKSNTASRRQTTGRDGSPATPSTSTTPTASRSPCSAWSRTSRR